MSIGSILTTRAIAEYYNVPPGVVRYAAKVAGLRPIGMYCATAVWGLEQLPAIGAAILNRRPVGRPRKGK